MICISNLEHMSSMYSFRNPFKNLMQTDHFRCREADRKVRSTSHLTYIHGTNMSTNMSDSSEQLIPTTLANHACIGKDVRTSQCGIIPELRSTLGLPHTRNLESNESWNVRFRRREEVGMVCDMKIGPLYRSME